MQIIDGKKISEELMEQVKADVFTLPFVPIFSDVLVGADFVSLKYVRMKARMAQAAGIKFQEASFPETITTEDLVEEIKKLNLIPNMCGIIVQLPLMAHIDKQKVLDAIDPQLDVDSLGSVQSQKFYEGDTSLGYPTALACVHILESLGENVKNKNITVLGQGELVGRPTTALLLEKGYTVITLNRDTSNKEEILKNSDVIISGIGEEGYLTRALVKEGVIIIDAGTSESGGTLVGDADYVSLLGLDGYISPVPGGVGPVTVAMLLTNVLKVAKIKINTT